MCELNNVCSLSIQEQMIANIIEQRNKEVDSIFIEGLEIKGYSFNNETELKLFIKDHCYCGTIENVKTVDYTVNTDLFDYTFI